ncbi:flagellar hook protein FlgE [Undibacterium sp. Ren11W]|uniref:flagellar hook protein FlgE n=1 Tax=Undibacterium sp. Ren11W TaxID=3413045 RepID=UPI003BF1B8D5
MGFQQGLSGLNAASKSLDVIGNNIANASTVGFKMAQAQFADVYANSLSGGGTNNVGIGTRLATVAQQFTQGNITGTNNPLDVAINGAGFFRMSTNGAITYSRNGQFQMDKNGGLVNAQGAQLTGYVADAQGVLSTGAAVPIVINTADVPANQTANINTRVNLDSRELVPKTTGTPPITTLVAFNPNDPSTFNKATSVEVFDSLGNPHILQTFYVQSKPVIPPPVAPVTKEWDVFTVVDGVYPPITPATLPVMVPPAPANSIGRVGFDAFGKLAVVNPSAASTPLAFDVRIDVPNTGSVTPISTPLLVKYDLTGSTQFGSQFSVNYLKQDGFTSGKLSKFNTSKDGSIVGSYTNGTTRVLAQVVVANFVNPNGLQPLGDNQWNETATSGQPLVGSPGSGNLGGLVASSTEDSNTDLTGELVNMITAQRIYQANAQTIKTQDQVLQTLVNLR